MSSTNRGSERHEADYYTTPILPIIAFLNAAKEDIGPVFNPATILDPCAGGDSQHPMSYPAAFAQVFPQATVTTIDIREDSLAEWVGDYLEAKDLTQAEFVCSNPPFALAMEFIKKALWDSSKWTAMLLRLNYFGTDKRFAWWKEHMPVYTYVHAKRMCFTGNGKTDSTEYMHCLWEPGNYPKHTKLRVI